MENLLGMFYLFFILWGLKVVSFFVWDAIKFLVSGFLKRL